MIRTALVVLLCSLCLSACATVSPQAAERPPTVTPVVVVLTGPPAKAPTATPLPTANAAAPTPSASATPAPPLPALYVDGAYILRSDTRRRVWLKGINVVEFWAEGPHTFKHLYDVRGLRKVIEDKWPINLLRVDLDVELFDSYAGELDSLLTFAQNNGIYCMLTPFASATDPSRGEGALPVPDQIIADFMGRLAARYKGRSNVLYDLWNEAHPGSISGGLANPLDSWQVWIDEVFKIVDDNPQLVHYAFWVMDSHDIGGTFDNNFALTPRGKLLNEDLTQFPPTPVTASAVR